MNKYRVEVWSYLEVKAENDIEAYKKVRETVCDMHREAFVHEVKKIGNNIELQEGFKQ